MDSNPLLKVDPNTARTQAERPSEKPQENGHSTAHKQERMKKDSRANAYKENNDEGELFRPQFMGNKFDWRTDVLHQNEDDEQRVDTDPKRPVSPTRADSSVQAPTINGNGNGNGNGADNASHNQQSGVVVDDSNGKVGPQEPTSNGPTLPRQGQEQLDANDSPTWYRRFSRIQTGLANNETWKDWGRALKFGRKKDAAQEAPQLLQPKKQPVDESEEAARIRASNLVTSLISGSPAALFLASSFQKDERGTRRAPILLSLLDVKVEDITVPGSRHRKYMLYLEYGVGPNRLKWTVVKDQRELLGLHSRLKLSLFQSKSLKGHKNVDLPKFPRYDKDLEGEYPSQTLNDGYLSGKIHIQEHEEPAPLRNTRPPARSMRHASTTSNASIHTVSSGGFRDRLHNITSIISSHTHHDGPAVDDFSETYRRKLENYLKQLVMALSLRPQANKLFQFFEISPLGVLLSYEGGYQGKQGYLIVSSRSKAQGWRVGHLKMSDWKQMVERHTNKWFLVRNSYVMYVSDIYSTTPLEVFMVDKDFKITFSGSDNIEDIVGNENESLYDDGLSLASFEDAPKDKKRMPHFTIKLENGERELKVIARSENQAKLWVHSLQTMAKNTLWSKDNRFGSFAPVRQNCFAQWFVDGRDHMWAVSSALEMAKDVIYIHDWWLSPELYMRRPANGNQEWRLDRILKRKAEQGVKVFVIVYRNVGSTVVTDSLWTKHSLIDLHENVHVMRSPNQWLQNTYFWAHHEKLCIVDHTVAFVGGIDLCYGRYDTPDHVLVDDSPHDFATRQSPTEDSVKFQAFPGKDYSNPRVKDFYALDKPYESMYDREVTPRMPWHDVHMMTAGQPARDLSRHFVQRWNYLLRQKRPSRPTPILTPPPDFSPEDLERFDLSGTCEVQMLRSAANWSLGLKEVESSIQSAYLRLIETSQHYIYIENQFFVTSTEIDGVTIENRIGDALTDRIIRAAAEKKKWKAFILVPLMPGFESQVDEAEGSAVRVIMQCQYQSISRGDYSIFGKLRKLGINPFEYIQFYSLRKWGRIGPQRKLISEQLYIHAKILIVDDRTALIGSANINERSQVGMRDSEVACVVRDTELVNSTMDGKPYKASKFAHTLRMRLMREHMGVDVDILDIVERRFSKLEELSKKTKTGKAAKTNNFFSKDCEAGSAMVELASRDVLNMPDGTEKWKKFQKIGHVGSSSSDTDYDEINQQDAKENLPAHLQEKSHKPVSLVFHSFNNRAREENAGIRDKKQLSSDARILNNQQHKNDVDGTGDGMGTPLYQKHKIDSAKTLKKWANESLVCDTTDVFLPNIDQVLEFLDDTQVVKDPSCLSPDEEVIVGERNQERWNMLKRISYLQRVAAKHKIQTDEENQKRAKVNLPTLFTLPKSKTGSQVVDGVSSTLVDHLEVPASDFIDESSSDVKNMDSSGVVGGLPGDDIPVVSLDPAGVKRLLESLMPGEDPSKFNKLIDPYCFYDPLIGSFYEDVWWVNAKRNTLLFREVFHCQPDDTVPSWHDYKTFTTLNTAFHLAQDQDATRRSASLRASSSGESVGNVDESRSTFANKTTRGGSVRVPDPSELRRGSILGANVPPDSTTTRGPKNGIVDGEQQAEDGDEQPTAPKAGKSSEYGSNKRSSFGMESVYDRETADRLLSEIQGHLVMFPTKWLENETEGDNWFYNMDRLPPLEIYD